MQLRKRNCHPKRISETVGFVSFPKPSNLIRTISDCRRLLYTTFIFILIRLNPVGRSRSVLSDTNLMVLRSICNYIDFVLSGSVRKRRFYPARHVNFADAILCM